MEEIKNKVLVKHGLLEGAAPEVNLETGEIIDDLAPAKKAKKSPKKLQ